MDEYGKHRIPSSRQEMEYVHYLENIYPDLLHAFNTGKEKLPRLLNSTPDAYCPSEKLWIYFHGCAIHGNLILKDSCAILIIFILNE